jgi:tRNA pseudouridine55 synthase
LFGIILINKPLEMTSHDVVGILRKRFNTKRIGHAGTLDPMATGLLVLAVGPATRFLQYLPLEPKVYVAKIEFGKSTNSFDQEG